MKNPLANIKGNKLLYLITATSSSGFLLFGYDNGVFSGINVLPWFLTTFSKNTNIFSTINAIFLVGAALGALVVVITGDRLGRRWTIFMGCVIGVIGAIVQGTPTEVVQLIIGRVVSGVAVGVLTSTVGVWQAETTPAAVRGRYMSMQLFFGGFGNLLSTWISYGFHNTEGRLPFMFPLLFQMVFPVVTGSLILLLPESPRWLIKKGRVEEAVAIMKRLQGLGPADEAPDSTIPEEVRAIMEVDRLERESKGIFGGMFRNGPTRNFKRILLGCAVTSFHQLNGINSISYYVPTLATNFIGAPRSEALWINGLNSIWVITFSIIPVLFLDRFGRRVFLWFPTCIQALAFVIVAILLSQAPPVSTHGGADSYGIAILSFIFLFSAVNDASWFGTSWVYPAELMPLHLREKGMGLAVILYWLFDFMMVEITPIALSNIGYKFYVILAVFNVVIAALIYFFFPETANKTLEEIDLQFAREWQVSTDAKVVGVDPKNSVPAGEGSGQNGNDGAAPSEMSEEPASRR